MLYVPDNLPYNACYNLTSNYTLRVYESVPRQNATINYIDVALDNHYIYREGQSTFSQYSSLPACISSDRITSAWIYRTDFFEILGCLAIIIGLLYFVLSRPIKMLFRGWV